MNLKQKAGSVLDVGREVTVLVSTDNEIVDFNPFANQLHKFYNKNAMLKKMEVLKHQNAGYKILFIYDINSTSNMQNE